MSMMNYICISNDTRGNPFRAGFDFDLRQWLVRTLCARCTFEQRTSAAGDTRNSAATGAEEVGIYRS